MQARIFDELARRTASLMTRKEAIGILGGSLIGMTALAGATEAKKKKKKKKKKKCPALNQRCQATTIDFCSQAPTEQERIACEEDLFECCRKTALQCTSESDMIACCRKAGWPC